MSSPGFDLFLWIGGYWSSDGSYVGGDSYQIGRVATSGFTLDNVESIVIGNLEVEDGPKKFAWFPPDSPENREDIEDDEVLNRAKSYGVKAGALTLFVVRKDDPYLNRSGEMLGDISSEDEGDHNEDVEEDGSGSDKDSESDDNNEAGLNEELEVDNANDNELVREEDGERSDSDGPSHEVLDESKYKKFALGQSYATLETFKSAITKYAFKKKYDISFFKSDSKRVVAVCCNRKCPWRIYGSINSTSSRCVIRSLQEEHNCSWQGRVTLLNNARISELFEEEFRLNPHFSATQLQAKLLRRNINVTWTICERSRLRCLNSFDAEQAESFAKMFDYVHELRRSNPGTSAECEVRQGIFHRFYVCFGALKHGWKAACRKIIHVDGTFLKWRMTGMLLVACGRDPNDQMYPIAWAIVDSETKENWLWFFEHLVDDLGLQSGNGLTLMSDQCKGLIGAVEMVLPFAEHRLCARHVYHNWKKLYSGAEYEDIFWGAAKAYYMAAFERIMEELKSVSQDAYDHLKLHNSCPWSRAYFTEIATCEAVENNLGESFNAAIRVARTKPIVEMLEEIRRGVLVSNEKKKNEADKAKGAYTPRSLALLDHQINLTKHCRPLHCGMGKYEVGYFTDGFVVHMRGEIKCACRMYVTSGIPCCHILSALRFEKNADQDPKSLISEWFTVEKLRKCYEISMEPVNGMNLWTKTTDQRVLPPPFKKPPGRPPGKKRRREKGEPREKGKMSKVGLKMHCSNCGQEGHNKGKCKNAHVPKLKKPNGRPRKHPLPITAPQASTVSQAVVGSQASTVSQAATSSQAPSKAKRGRPRKQSTDASQASQTSQAPRSISKALPKPKPGRPRRSWFDASTSQQEAPTQPAQPTRGKGRTKKL